MVFFDTHCDTVGKVLDGRLDFRSGEGEAHVSLDRLRAAGVRAQVFACFVLSELAPGRERETADRMVETLHTMAATSDGALRVATTGHDVRDAFGDGPIAMLIGLEGGDPLEGDADRLRDFHRSGVRIVIPAWQDNAFSGTAFGTDTCLTDEGRKLVALAEELRVLVDVSHLSDSAFADVCHLAGSPFMASHSNCRALCPTLRNLTNGMIRELADRGGVMGINLASGFLDPAFLEQEKSLRNRRPSNGGTPEAMEAYRAVVAGLPRPDPAWVARHVCHAIDTGGEECVGLGGDLDGVTSTPLGIDGVEDYPKLVDLLQQAGLSSSQIEKVCWRNFERLFTAVLPD